LAAVSALGINHGFNGNINHGQLQNAVNDGLVDWVNDLIDGLKASNDPPPENTTENNKEDDIEEVEDKEDEEEVVAGPSLEQRQLEALEELARALRAFSASSGNNRAEIDAVASALAALIELGIDHGFTGNMNQGNLQNAINDGLTDLIDSLIDGLKNPSEPPPEDEIKDDEIEDDEDEDDEDEEIEDEIEDDEIEDDEDEDDEDEDENDTDDDKTYVKLALMDAQREASVKLNALEELEKALNNFSASRGNNSAEIAAVASALAAVSALGIDHGFTGNMNQGNLQNAIRDGLTDRMSGLAGSERDTITEIQSQLDEISENHDEHRIDEEPITEEPVIEEPVIEEPEDEEPVLPDVYEIEIAEPKEEMKESEPVDEDEDGEDYEDKVYEYGDGEYEYGEDDYHSDTDIYDDGGFEEYEPAFEEVFEEMFYDESVNEPVWYEEVYADDPGSEDFGYAEAGVEPEVTGDDED
jgi:hypothetical protein